MPTLVLSTVTLHFPYRDYYVVDYMHIYARTEYVTLYKPFFNHYYTDTRMQAALFDVVKLIENIPRMTKILYADTLIEPAPSQIPAHHIKTNKMWLVGIYWGVDTEYIVWARDPVNKELDPTFYEMMLLRDLLGAVNKARLELGWPFKDSIHWIAVNYYGFLWVDFPMGKTYAQVMVDTLDEVHVFWYEVKDKYTTLFPSVEFIEIQGLPPEYLKKPIRDFMPDV